MMMNYFFKLLMENYELKRQIKGLKHYLENLKQKIPKDEKEEDLPLNLSELFPDM